MQTDRISIDKKFVHKIKDENVFLCNLRRELPLTISRNLFEHEFKKVLNEEEYWYLTCFYRLYSPSRGDGNAGTREESYAVRYLPAIHFLSPDVYAKLLESKSTAWEKELIRNLYVNETDRQGEYFRLKEVMAEPFDGFLLSSLKAWDLFVNQEERTVLSDVFEKVPQLGKRNIFMANMFVNTGHPYFFEHPYDHVPSLMLIETVKQFVLACSHRFGNVPVHDTHIIVDKIDCRFSYFVNMNYPVLLKSTSLELKTNRQGFWKYQKVLVEVFQASRRLGEFTFSGNCISSEIFNAIREAQMDEIKQARFIPLRDNICRVELLPEGYPEAMEGTLVNLSLEGMLVKVKEHDFIPGGDVYDLSLTYGIGKTIKGRYQSVWQATKAGHMLIGMKSIQVGEDDLRKIFELIRLECSIQEERELV